MRVRVPFTTNETVSTRDADFRYVTIFHLNGTKNSPINDKDRHGSIFNDGVCVRQATIVIQNSSQSHT